MPSHLWWYTARAGGTYYLEAKLIAPVRDTVSYRLSLAKIAAR